MASKGQTKHKRKITADKENVSDMASAITGSVKETMKSASAEVSDGNEKVTAEMPKIAKTESAILTETNDTKTKRRPNKKGAEAKGEENKDSEPEQSKQAAAPAPATASEPEETQANEVEKAPSKARGRKKKVEAKEDGSDDVEMVEVATKSTSPEQKKPASPAVLSNQKQLSPPAAHKTTKSKSAKSSAAEIQAEIEQNSKSTKETESPARKTSGRNKATPNYAEIEGKLIN
jgi:hypothetical protein